MPLRAGAAARQLLTSLVVSRDQARLRKIAA